MCEKGATVKLNLINIHNQNYIDRCIAPLIKALNDGEVETIASCCGHGKVLGSIILKDKSELMIIPSFKMARNIENYILKHSDLEDTRI